MKVHSINYEVGLVSFDPVSIVNKIEVHVYYRASTDTDKAKVMQPARLLLKG